MRGEPAAADPLYEELAHRSPFWEDRYSATLFALSYLSQRETSRRFEEIQRWLDTTELSDSIRAEFTLLQAEFARIRGDIDRARLLAGRAITLDPDNGSAFTYRAILARP
jgi:hypothetical protein